MLDAERKYEKENNLIRKINNGGGYFSEEDEVYLKEMASEGILRKKEGEYFLTSYGKTIKVMGYKVHLETRRLEDNLPLNDSKKSNFLVITLSFFLSISGCYSSPHCFEFR